MPWASCSTGISAPGLPRYSSMTASRRARSSSSVGSSAQHAHDFTCSLIRFSFMLSDCDPLRGDVVAWSWHGLLKGDERRQPAAAARCRAGSCARRRRSASMRKSTSGLVAAMASRLVATSPSGGRSTLARLISARTATPPSVSDRPTLSPPPAASAAWRKRLRPRPVFLSSLVVKNGSSTCSGLTGRPGPSSSTVITSRSALAVGDDAHGDGVAPARTEFSRMSSR